MAMTAQPRSAADRPPIPAREVRPVVPAAHVSPVLLDQLAPRAVLEACRSALVRAAGADGEHVAVTSALRNEGRSTIALGMAVVQQRDFQRKTLLVELDVERPSLARRLGLAPTPGLAELIRDEADIDACMRQIGEDLVVLPAGDAGDEPARLFAELVRGDRLRQLQLWCEVMVADLPPVLSSNPTPQIARHFPVLVQVIRAGATPTARVQEAVAELPTKPTLVLNSVESSLPRWIRRLVGD